MPDHASVLKSASLSTSSRAPVLLPELECWQLSEPRFNLVDEDYGVVVVQFLSGWICPQVTGRASAEVWCGNYVKVYLVVDAVLSAKRAFVCIS